MIRSLLNTTVRRVIALAVVLVQILHLFLSGDMSFHVYSIVSAVPYCLSIPLILFILAEYEAKTSMHTAWLLMLISAIFGGLRHLIEAFQINGFHIGSMSAIDISVIAVVLSLTTLIISLVMMLHVFRMVGVRVPLRLSDKLLLAFTAILFAACFMWTDSFPHHDSPIWLIRHLEYLNPILIAAGVFIGLKLYRFSLLNGTSAWTLSLYCLVVELLVRFLAFMVLVFGGWTGLYYRYFELPQRVLFYYVPWLFLLAVVGRWDVIADAKRYASAELKEDQYAASHN
jgi:hypothetical protein